MQPRLLAAGIIMCKQGLFAVAVETHPAKKHSDKNGKEQLLLFSQNIHTNL